MKSKKSKNFFFNIKNRKRKGKEPEKTSQSVKRPKGKEPEEPSQSVKRPKLTLKLKNPSASGQSTPSISPGPSGTNPITCSDDGPSLTNPVTEETEEDRSSRTKPITSPDKEISDEENWIELFQKK